MSSPSLRLAFLCMMGALLTLPAAAAEPVGIVDVNVEPNAATIVGTGEVTLTVSVSAEIECTDGTEAPASLVGFSSVDDAPADDVPSWHVTPRQLALDWQPVEGEPGTYRVDSVETITVTLDEAVEEPETHVLDFIVPGADGRAQGKVCSAEGYSFKGDSDSATLHFEPQAAESVAAADSDAGFARMQLLPLMLAIGLVAVLAMFASLRNRGKDAE